MIVISLFDGISCGLTALKRAGIKVKEYHAFEIDKYAIQIAKKNHPEIIHHGSVVGFNFEQFKNADLLIGGSPCQGFSFAGKQLAFDDERSKLFFEFIRAKKEIQPKNFLLENVVMKKKYEIAISRLINCYPVEINSALVSAQNRNRLYWCNWKVRQPRDKEIYLKDIIENGVVDRNKSYCIDANYYKGGSIKNYFEKSRRQIVMAQSEKRLMVHIVAQRGRNIVDGKRKDFRGAPTDQWLEPKYDGKNNCLTSVHKDNYLADGATIRKLTPIECERLQTMSDNYTEGVSNTQRYKALGNGWTVDVIVHLLNELYNSQDNDKNSQANQQELF